MSGLDDYTSQLELWATLAAQELQEFCDDAQAANGNPDGEDQLLGTRELIKDLDQIMAPKWLDQISTPFDGLDLKGLE